MTLMWGLRTQSKIHFQGEFTMTMATTPKQDKEIASELNDGLSFSISGREITVRDTDMSFLVGFIGNAFIPEQVFSENDLRDWALRNGFVEE